MATTDLVDVDDNGLYSIVFAEALINALWGIVQTKSALADAKTQEAIDLADGDYSISSPDLSNAISEAITTFKENVARPDLPSAPEKRTAPVVPAKIDPLDLPAVPTMGPAPVIPLPPGLDAPPDLGDLDVTQLQNLYWENRAEIMEMLKAAFSDYMAEWFPAGTYFEKATAWLERALGEGGTSINTDVENALWERDRARLAAEAARAEDEAMTAFASRGYVLPPGSLVHGVLTIRQGLTNALSQQSRDITIKAHQDELDNARLALQQAISLRGAAMSAAINYMQALAVAPQIATTLATAQIDGQTRIASARADLFRTVTGAKTDIYRAVAGVESDVYKTITGAQSDFFKAEAGAKSDLYRAQVEGWRAGVTADADVYRAVTSAEADAYRTLVDAMTRLYSTDAQVAQVPLDAVFKKATLDFNVADANLKAKLAMVAEQVKAAVAAAQQVATQASAALNNLNVNTSVSNGTTTSFVQR
ncbi:hypothetical protein [Acidovorax sp. K2F]|uniref:hypothetical protein n=1 Tax=Acidovorax sp. K2F TaxID=2978125 RepID=UPI0021B0FECA|nr:hypothetical protein [Acidovorax sp. K2F]MCT6719428.1 hypothetical protein [Acidovorax sp. K2F]